MGIFKILVDAANEAFALSKVVVGDAINGTKNGIVAFVFRDSNGNATTVQLNGEGSVPVTADPGTTKRGSQVVASGGLVKDTEVEILTIDLVAEKVYSKFSAMAVSFRATELRLVYVDDYGVADTEEELGYGMLDAGNLESKINLAVDEFSTVGGTNVQKLVLFGTPRDAIKADESDIKASVSVNEIL